MASEILVWKQSIVGGGALPSLPRFVPPSNVLVDPRETRPLPPVSPPIVPAPPRSDEGETDAAHAIGVDQRLRRHKRLRRAFVAFGWMRDVGLILIAFAAWQLWGTSIEQSQAQQTLRQQFESHLPATPPPTTSTSTGPTLISAAINAPAPPEGSAVGRLEIPAIGVDQYVVQGTSEADLAKGPGHYIGTSMPGQAGNVAIAGHRTTYGAPFNNLNALKIGDQISLTNNAGERLSYVVSANPVAVSPNDVSVLNSAADNRLTLTTCNPRFSSSQRLVVVAELSEPHTVAVATTPSTRQPRRVRIVTEPIGWNTGYVPIVLLLAALLIGLGLANRRARRVYGGIGRWLVLTPIWVAGLFFLFESLSRLLPANL
jgi:sortase A